VGGGFEIDDVSFGTRFGIRSAVGIAAELQQFPGPAFEVARRGLGKVAGERSAPLFGLRRKRSAQ
jgi:hypothetical protein